MSTKNGTPGTTASTTPSTDVSNYRDRFRGRAPSEMLGLPRESSLRGSFVLATLTTAVLFVALTVLPYYLPKVFGSAEPTTPVEAPKVEAPKPEPTKPDAKTPATAQTPVKKGEAATTPTTAAATPLKSPDLLDKLKESGVKTASPKVNPLDKKDDDILKDLDRK